VENQTVPVPPSGEMCGTEVTNDYWLCQADSCTLEQDLNVSLLSLGDEEITVEVGGSIRAVTSLWPFDYASVTFVLTFWRLSDGNNEVLELPSGIQKGTLAVRVSPTGVIYSSCKRVYLPSFDFVTFVVQVTTSSYTGAVLVGVDNLKMRLYRNYSPNVDSNDFIQVVCDQPVVNSVAIAFRKVAPNTLPFPSYAKTDYALPSKIDVPTNSRITTTPSSDSFQLEGLQPQQYYFAGVQDQLHANGFSYAVAGPETLITYHTYTDPLDPTHTADRFLCNLQLYQPGTSKCTAPSQSGKNVSFEYMLLEADVVGIPWVDVLVPPAPLTPPYDPRVLWIALISLAIFFVLGIASFIGLYVWQSREGDGDESLESVVGREGVGLESVDERSSWSEYSK